MYDFTGIDTLDYCVYLKAITAFKELNLDKKIITVIDYTKSIKQNRLWVLDLKKRVVLYNTKVSHGQNSGKDLPTKFSNKDGSHKSSYGRFITGDTYKSSTVGYALRLHGIDSFNSNVYSRGIVIHGTRSKRNDVVGRSWGCPTLPTNKYKEIIEVIKDSTFLYIYKGDD